MLTGALLVQTDLRRVARRPARARLEPVHHAHPARAGFESFIAARALEENIERLARSFIRVHPRVLGLLADNGPERLFARLNQILPGLVDFSLPRQLPVIRRHARESDSQITSQGAHP